MRKILIVVGTRPNFIKITRFKSENHLLGKPFDIRIVHTGQHYDDKMASVFFDQFELTPDYFLNIPSGSPSMQMAEIMLRLEKTILEFNPDLVMVPGDVNSTFAAALTCNKMNVKLAHLESGLRSFDRTMPEEFNRVLTDEVSDYFFVTEHSGMKHLEKEGKKMNHAFLVGNTMIDTMVAFDHKIQQNKIMSELNLLPSGYVLMTMHRPATVDSSDGLKKLIEVIGQITDRYQVVFPVHPRTMKRMSEFGLLPAVESNRRLVITEPLDYFAFQKLIIQAAFVLTDSGGIQEETTFRKIPCLTLRPNTERPCTVETGTNELIPFDYEIIRSKVNQIAEGKYKKGAIPPLWDGKSTKRILEHCLEIIPEKTFKKAFIPK